MSVVHAWAGATTEDAAWVRAKISGSSARLAVDTDPGFSDPVMFGPVSATSDDIVSIRATGLEPDQRYYYTLEVDDILDEDWTGTFRTHPPVGEPGDFRVAVVSCAGSVPDYPGINGARIPNRISNSPAHLHPLAVDPLMLIHVGDIAYYDPGSGNHGVSVLEGSSPAFIREMLDDVFRQPNQAELYRSVATAYMQDDHDGGPNDHDGTSPSYPAQWQVYRERVPHYDLPSDSHNAQTWVIGRVQFILWDVRSQRDPNSSPPGPSKTMLGQEQRDWFEAILASSTASAIVICNPSDWASPSRADSWAAFADERDWVAERIHAYGWGGRTVMVGGDLHALGLDTGTVSPGGIPLLHVASIDSSPSGAPTHLDMGGLNGRQHFGTVDVVDEGLRISITLTGWENQTPWRSYTHVIDFAPPPPPPPDPVPPPVVAVPVIRQAVHWQGVDDRTGRVIADLPDTVGVTSRLLMAYTSSKLEIPLGDLPIEVIEQATQPQGCSIVQIVNDLPIWAGRILVRSGGSGPRMTLGVASSEQYLLHRHVTAHEYVDLDRAQIAVDLLSDAGSTDTGPGMALEIDYQPTGDAIDRTYLPTDLVTVYRALRELSEAGTLEWTIDYDWASAAQTVLRRIMRLRPRIGAVDSNHPMFDVRNDCTYTLNEDFTSGRYANHVRVYGDGEGDDLPMSDAHVDQAALDAGRPLVEHALHIRDISDPNELNAIAAAALARMMHGVELWEITSPLQQWPRPGMDAGLGDWAAWYAKGPRHPHGVEGAGRVIGWDLDAAAANWTPKLLDPHETAIEGTA